MMAVTAIDLPLPLLRRGKVREVFEVDADRLLLVASDRVSAFDVVMAEPIPRKGAVLTQLSAWWFRQMAGRQPSHFLASDSAGIVREVPALAGHEESIAGRTMLVRRTRPVPFECVVRGYIAGSAWKEYLESGTLAGEPLPVGLRESDQLESPLFSPATKAETGHDENVRFAQLEHALGAEPAAALRDASLALYQAGRDVAAERGIIVADTKFEFGHDAGGELLLIDEALTPDSSRFWPADRYQPGRSQPSFDKQPLRDWLAGERTAGRWDGDSPAPALPPDVVRATSERYLDAYRRLTGHDLPEDA
ncbi:MAG TPA: phosphoribosylaminoimidazolesuccinocarboxamide synthase [Gemmatimonadales bacterium]|nr:phosphoribosylaminoimidazolesuccinocarboxamide synthase [Gemmatimonadales bacterium]